MTLAHPVDADHTVLIVFVQDTLAMSVSDYSSGYGLREMGKPILLSQMRLSKTVLATV